MRLGIQCGFYRNTASQTPWATPTWNEITIVRDLSFPPTWDSVEVMSRENAVKLSAKTMLAVELTCSIRVAPADSDYDALMSALYTRDPIDILVLNGKVDRFNSRGLRFWAHVFGGAENQGVGEALYHELTLRPAMPATSTELPQLAIVGSTGSPPTVAYTSLAI